MSKIFTSVTCSLFEFMTKTKKWYIIYYCMEAKPDKIFLNQSKKAYSGPIVGIEADLR